MDGEGTEAGVKLAMEEEAEDGAEDALSWVRSKSRSAAEDFFGITEDPACMGDADAVENAAVEDVAGNPFEAGRI